MISIFRRIKNKTNFIFLTKIFIFVIFSSYSSIALARGGGGGSGGGGGGGGGGGFSGHGSGRPLTLWDMAYAAFWALLIIIPVVIAWYKKKKKIEKAEILLKEAKSTDSKWDKDLLKNKVTETFLKFQEDWSNFNVERMKEYLTEDYYKRMVLEMNVLKNENRQNIMSGVSISSLNFLEIQDESDNNKDNFTIEVNAMAQDSLYDTTNNSLLYRDSNPFSEYWNFLRQGDDWKLNLIKQATEDTRSIENDIVDFAKRNNFYYDPDFGWLMMPNKGVIFSKNNFKTSDINNHVVGYFRDKIVEFYTFIPNAQSRASQNFLVAQMVLPIRYNDILVRRKRALINIGPWGMRRIKTESNDFERKFCLWADPSDQISSFELLSPDFMEKIYELPFELNIEIVGNFLYFYSEKRSGVNYDKMLEILSWAFDEMKM